jgi:hypothetical protein
LATKSTRICSAARAADASQLDPLAIVVTVERFERGGMGNDLSQPSAADGLAEQRPRSRIGGEHAIARGDQRGFAKPFEKGGRGGGEIGHGRAK